jgi:hypothetical protein
VIDESSYLPVKDGLGHVNWWRQVRYEMLPITVVEQRVSGIRTVMLRAEKSMSFPTS